MFKIIDKLKKNFIKQNMMTAQKTIFYEKAYKIFSKTMTGA